MLLKHHFDSNKAKQSVSKYKSLLSDFVPPSLKYNSLDIDSISMGLAKFYNITSESIILKNKKVWYNYTKGE